MARNSRNPQHDASRDPLKGEPIPIVVSTKDHRFELKEKALEEILHQPSICDKKVSIISVTGAFRKGKSFLLNFFLRYLSAQGRSDWLGPDNIPLEGFPWRGGSERQTAGILMWSEPFIVTKAGGEKIAVLLIDTEGSFDSTSSTQDCATIFSLSTLISSVQVYNLMQNIQEDDLQHLLYFSEYGRLALKSSSHGVKPFQSLWFLVRDWDYIDEYPYGEEGGKQFLDKRLKVSDKQHSELSATRRYIESCFEKKSCFLLPHPGQKARESKFEGKLVDISKDFLDELQLLVQTLFSGQNIVVKEIEGQKIACKNLMAFFKAFVELYQGEDLPTPGPAFQLAVEKTNMEAHQTSMKLYCEKMEESLGTKILFFFKTTLDGLHRVNKAQAVKLFRSISKMGVPEFIQGYEKKLEKDIDEKYKTYVQINDLKQSSVLKRAGGVGVAMFVYEGIRLGVVGLSSTTGAGATVSTTGALTATGKVTATGAVAGVLVEGSLVATGAVTVDAPVVAAAGLLGIGAVALSQTQKHRK